MRDPSLVFGWEIDLSFCFKGLLSEAKGSFAGARRLNQFLPSFLLDLHDGLLLWDHKGAMGPEGSKREVLGGGKKVWGWKKACGRKAKRAGNKG